MIDDHHNISMRILVGRSLPDGSPWTVAEERALIAEERRLWSLLTSDEQAQEQSFLEALWSHRGASRTVTVDREWGGWAISRQGQSVSIPDSAFGIPSQQLRPYFRGLPEGIPERMRGLVEWLWSVGYQPVGCSLGYVSLLVPYSRLLAESDRLYSLLISTYPETFISAYGVGDIHPQIRSIYDPVGGRAFIEVLHLTDDELHGL